jgi:diphosphomevalonate decarboxylase
MKYGQDGLRTWVKAPANLALIKYMGKRCFNTNLPINPSLSYTLSDRLAYVSISPSAASSHRWQPLVAPKFDSITLSAKEKTKLFKHIDRVQRHVGYQGSWCVASANNFPKSIGIASSSAFFAALTTALLMAISQQGGRPFCWQQAKQLSRWGSGSACRSFDGPWVAWHQASTQALTCQWRQLKHIVILRSTQAKPVTSTQAHRQVKTSPHYHSRFQSARMHYHQARQALAAQDWQALRSISWQEFEQMHQLFETANPTMSYRSPQTMKALSDLQNIFKQDGPVITMDAGQAIHCFFLPHQTSEQQQLTDWLAQQSLGYYAL